MFNSSMLKRCSAPLRKEALLSLLVGFFVSAGMPAFAEEAAPVETSPEETVPAEVEIAEETPIDPRISPELLAAYESHELKQPGITLPYRLMRPVEVEIGKTYPLVLFLHGFGERGDDNQRQLIHGASNLADPALRKRHPAFVVAPQCPTGEETAKQKADVPQAESSNQQPEQRPNQQPSQRLWTWRVPKEDSPGIELAGQATPQLEAVRALVTQLKETLPIDENRIYITGLSMGGFATWELIIRDPQLYAAAAPVCGASDPQHAARLVGLPLWAFHGDKDGVVFPERTEAMINAIRTAGGQPIHTLYEGVGHDSWTATYRSQQFWDWFFTQQRTAE